MLCEIGFEPLGKLTPGEHYAPSAALAFEPNIRTETCDGPFVGATRMLFAEAEMVVELQVRKHMNYPLLVSIISLVLKISQTVYVTASHVIFCK